MTSPYGDGASWLHELANFDNVMRNTTGRSADRTVGADGDASSDASPSPGTGTGVDTALDAARSTNNGVALVSSEELARREREAIEDDARRQYALAQLSDLGIAERFIRKYQGQVMFVPGIGWHEWDHVRKIWQLDKVNNILQKASGMGYVLQQELDRRRELMTNAQIREYETHKKSAESYRGMKAVVGVAEADARIKFESTALNADPWSLVVKNGTLDLRTGELHDSRPDDRNTQQADVSYVAGATCPRFDELLEYAFPKDPGMIAYIWRVLGYALTGLTDEQEFFFLWGERYSAKSTISEVLVRLLGTYASTLDENALTGSGNDHPTWIADLFGKRVVYQDELDANKRINTGRVNRLTGSSLPLKGRQMRADFFDVKIQCKIFITTNHRPPMGNAQDGIWRRIRPWHFGNPWPEHKRIKEFSRILVDEEGPGILNRCLEGLKDYLGEDGKRSLGLRTPLEILGSAKDYQNSEDQLTPFIEDHFVNTGDVTHWVANADIFQMYTDWCDANNVHVKDRLSGVQLSKHLVERKFVAAAPCRARRSGITGHETRTMRGFLGMQINVDITKFGYDTMWKTVTEPKPK